MSHRHTGPVVLGVIVGLIAVALSLVPEGGEIVPPDDSFELSIRIEGSGHVGSINDDEIACPPDCAHEYRRLHEPDRPPYEEAHVQAYPDVGARFLGFEGHACEPVVAMSCLLPMDRDRAIVARFTDTGRSPSLTVRKTGSGLGTVLSARISFDDPKARVGPGNLPTLEDVDGIDCGFRCVAEYASAAERVLTAYPANGSRFVGWSGRDADCHTRDRPFCVVRIDGVEEVRATFETLTGDDP